MSSTIPFRPSGGATTSITVGAASARVALSSGEQQLVMNNGTATAWIAFGDGTVAATTATGMPIGPGVSRVITIPPGITQVAAIAAAASGLIHFTPGSGF